jgi:hypothetical protein
LTHRRETHIFESGSSSTPAFYIARRTLGNVVLSLDMTDDYNQMHVRIFRF